MRPRPFASAAALLAALVLAPSALALGPLATAVPDTEDGLGQSLTLRSARLAWIDLDLDQAHDTAGVEEPVYLDLDESGTVNLGDVRITAFAGHVAFSDVMPADTDNQRQLSAFVGWYARTGGQWLADLDGTQTVSPGDLRAATGQRVAPGDADVGHVLERPLGANARQVALRDADGDMRHTPGEPVFLDTDGNLAVSAGDLRLATGALPPAAAVELQDDAPVASADGMGLRGLDIVLLAVGLLNLVGLAMLARRREPREPPGAP